jgi:hypothetical protein
MQFRETRRGNNFGLLWRIEATASYSISHRRVAWLNSAGISANLHWIWLQIRLKVLENITSIENLVFLRAS